MLPKTHLVIGAIFSLFLFILFPKVGLIEATLIFFSSSLLDIDHYIYYVYHKKSWNLKKAYKWFVLRVKELKKLPKEEQGKYKKPLLIFHGIEFWWIFIFLSFLFPLTFWILIGILLHTFLDIIEAINDTSWIIGKLSQTYIYIKNKNKKEFKFKIKKEKNKK